MYGNFGRQPWVTPGFNGPIPQGGQYVSPSVMGGYQQPMSNQQFDNTQRPSLQGVAWVNGLIGAQAYLIPANTSIVLMDSDGPFFYVKSSDMSGKADVKQFKYEEYKAEQSITAPVETSYVTKEEFEQFKASLLKKSDEEDKI